MTARTTTSASCARRPPPRQPRSPTPPAHLRRVDHPIDVPAAQRACPTCGGDRQCIEPHVTEVFELLPAEVIVRRDIREQLTCVACEGEPVRAPAGETVVPNGKLGLGLVASDHHGAASLEKMGDARLHCMLDDRELAQVASSDP